MDDRGGNELSGLQNRDGVGDADNDLGFSQRHRLLNGENDPMQ
jgi:hypothetical protein